MTEPVMRWMESTGMMVKAEFVTPWGMCDLVGLNFNKAKLKRRLEQGQRKAITSVLRAAILLEIPDVQEGKTITLNRLANKFSPFINKETAGVEVERLVNDGFVVRVCRGGLQKVNGWMPLQERLVAVELKLSRISEAMSQARNNLGFAEESYVALPANVARRVQESQSRWGEYFDAGVGLLGVNRRSCRVLTPARKNTLRAERAIRLYCVEKFWGMVSKATQH